MAWFRPSFKTHSDLIGHLTKSKIINHKEVAQALLRVDRADFAPNNAYSDSPQYIGHGATISAPHMHAHALNDLFDQLRPGSNALDVGSGSGYLSVAMAYMVGDKGKVIGIDHISELVALAKSNISKHHGHLLKNKAIEIICGDGRAGYPKEAPFDAIHVGAAASVQVANELCKQLKEGGKMVIPVQMQGGDQIFREYVKDKNGKISYENKVQVMYIPLTDEKSQRSRR
eukprot:4061_1